MNVWVDDVLPGHQRLVLELPLASPASGEPADQPLAGSLIRRRIPTGPRAVLYLHGWSDYYFQTHLGQWFEDQGFDFYAVELRRYGRNLMPGQLGGYITDLADYDQELDAALAVLRADHDQVTLMGHSTGGLISALWADRRPGELHGLILNSPWLDLQGSAMLKAITGPVMTQLSGRYPTRVIPLPESGIYIRSIHSSLDGEWDFDIDLKQHPSFQVRAAWLHAVMAGHDQVAAGLDITTPVLSLISTRSFTGREWAPEAVASDTVLDVDKLARRSVQLGPLVTVARIRDGLHDLALSSAVPRSAYFAQIERWMHGYLSDRSV